jgi:anti-sigma-K factor RskA
MPGSDVDIKKYISSGILEQYVLGLLSQEEQQAVENNLGQFSELRAELDQIEHALESYASLNKAKLSPDFYQKLSDKLDDITPDPAPPASGPPPVAGTGSGNLLSLLLGAALVASLGAAAWLYNGNQQKDEEIKTLTTNFNLLQIDCDKTTDMNRSLLETLQSMRQPGSSLIQMLGTAKAPAALASVIWNPTTQKAYLDVASLPEPPSDKQYQLWAIVDGAPVDMGVFEVVLNGTSLQEVPFIANPQAFAVTLEKRGGSPTPTLEEMVVVGNKVG